MVLKSTARMRCALSLTHILSFITQKYGFSFLIFKLCYNFIVHQKRDCIFLPERGFFLG